MQNRHEKRAAKAKNHTMNNKKSNCTKGDTASKRKT